MAIASIVLAKDHVDQGGGRITVWMDWEGGAPLWTRTSKCLMKVMRRTALSTYELVKYCYSGTPGQRVDVSGQLVPYSKPETTNLGEGTYLQMVTGYLPKLAPGVYWVQVSYLSGGIWTDLGDPCPIRIHPRTRPDNVYDLRKEFPNPPGQPGSLSMDQDPIIRG